MTPDIRAAPEPCPFCGCTTVANKDDGHEEWFECDWCHATSGYDPAPEFEAEPASFYWNRRARSVYASLGDGSQDRGAEDATRYARNLALSLWTQHYPEVSEWEPFDDLIGILTQIDNMTSGMVRAAAPATPSQNESLRLSGAMKTEGFVSEGGGAAYLWIGEHRFTKAEVLAALEDPAPAPAEQAGVFGPYGWLLMPYDLAEDDWELDSEPSLDTDHVRSVPLFALEDLPLGVLKAPSGQADTGYEKCDDCGGTGLALNMAGEPDECRECHGNTVVPAPAPAAGGEEAARYVNRKTKSVVTFVMEDGGVVTLQRPDGSYIWRGKVDFEREYDPIPTGNSVSAPAGAAVAWITNCCECGRIVDTRETSQGGDKFGCELNDGRWTCSFECWESAIGERPAPASDDAARVAELEDERDHWKKLFDQCAEARDAAGYLGSVPDCIAHFESEATEAEARATAAEQRGKVLEKALRTKRDYVSDAASGALTYEGSGEGFKAMALEDLARIDAALRDGGQ